MGENLDTSANFHNFTTSKPIGIDWIGNRSEITENILENGALCYHQEPVGFNRYLLIVGFGCPIAIFGFISNCLLVRVFAEKTKRNTPTLYLLALAFIDVWICLCYILIMGVDALAIYHTLHRLLYLWNQYLIPLFTISRIVELACPYIIIAATIERYILSADNPPNCLLDLTTNRARRSTLGLIIFLSTVFRIPTMFTMKIQYALNCTTDPLGTITIFPTALLASDEYQNYDFYFMPVIHTFLPISLLVILNFGILRNLRERYQTRAQSRTVISLTTRAKREARLKFTELNQTTKTDLPNGALNPPADELVALTNSDHGENEKSCPENSVNSCAVSEQLSPFATIGLNVNIFHQRKARFRQLREDRARFRGAAITLIAIVTSYLFCAFYSLLIRILERVQGHRLLIDENGENTAFYTISTDVISFLVLFNSFLRVFIYYVANKEFRSDFKQLSVFSAVFWLRD